MNSTKPRATAATFVGVLTLLAGAAAFLVPLQHAGPYGIPGRGLVGGLVCFAVSAVLLVRGTPVIARVVAYAASPLVLFFALYGALAELEETIATLVPLRDAMIKTLAENIEDVILTGHLEKRLPGHASFCVKYIEGEGLLLFLNQKGIMAASGSACTSRSLKGSHVLEAIGLDAATAQGSIIFTFGPENNQDEIGKVIEEMQPVVSRLREMSPIYREKKDGTL